MYSLYEGWHKLHSHEALQVDKLWWAVAVLVFAIAAESVSMRACMQEVNKSRGSRTLWQWFRQSRQAELVVIFGEDLAALLGLVFALIAVLLTIFTGNPLFDALGTLAIGVLLIVIAVLVGVEVKAMLIGQSVDPIRLAQMHQFLEARPEIAKVISVVTLQLGEKAMVSVQAQLSDDSVPTMVDAINTIERQFKAAFPEVQWSFFEPDIKAGV